MGSATDRVDREIAYQASLLDDGLPLLDADFGRLSRKALDERSWIEHCPGWLSGSDELFGELLGSGRFAQRTVRMYDRVLPEPRLTAGWAPEVGDGGAQALPAPLQAIAAALSGRYGVHFDRIWVNLYRDGHDSVAWHGDRNRHTHRNPLVATVSLGARRRFLLRPRGGRTALTLHPGHGDLVVMGGACQHEWEHTVPKESGAVGPRMSVTLRHTAHLGDPASPPTEVHLPGPGQR